MFLIRESVESLFTYMYIKWINYNIYKVDITYFTLNTTYKTLL